MVEIFAVSGLINALIAISLGFLVIFKNWRDKGNQLFFLMTASLALWGFGYWKWLESLTSSDALFWVKVFSIGSLFIPVFFFHWVLEILGKSRDYRIITLGTYTLCIFVFVFSFTPFFIYGVEQKMIFSFWPIPGILYSLYLFIVYLSLILFSIFILVKEYFSVPVDSDKRGQILYILVGAILGFGGGATNFPLWYNIPVLPVGTFLVAIFPFLFSYAALKHHLFSFKTIATEILVFFIFVALLVQAVLSTSLVEFILRFLFFIAVSIFGYLLIRSVIKEVEAREEIEKLAKDLEVANVRLKELDQLKSEFVSIASHQLRSPLTAIKGYASLILDGSFGKAPPAIGEAVGKMLDSSSRLVLIIEDFLNLSRIEQGRMKYDFVPTDIEAMVKNVVEELSPTIKTAGLSISFTTDNQSPYKSNLDVGKIKQVIGNIIDNSIKYTPRGSIQVSLKKSSDNKILITVSDTGIGISKDTLPTLFEKFSRAKDAGKTNTTGTGLGLYVAKQMVEAHGGRIWAESDGVGKGSRFKVELSGV